MDAIERQIMEMIDMLNLEFIVDECADGDSVPGCLSCDAIQARAALRAMLETMKPPSIKKAEGERE